MLNFKIVKAELVTVKSEYSIGTAEAEETTNSVKLTLVNGDDWQDEEEYKFVFFGNKSERIVDGWVNEFDKAGTDTLVGDDIPKNRRVLKNVVVDWYDLPEPCYKMYDKNIYYKGNLIHKAGEIIKGKDGSIKVYTKVKVLSYKKDRGDGEYVWMFDPEEIIQNMIGRIYFPMSTLASKPTDNGSKESVEEEDE